MKVIILGGNAEHNSLWIQELANCISRETDYSVYAHSYRHWQTNNKFIDIEYELQALAASEALVGEYSIIAKSMGSLLAMKGIYAGLFKPTASLFLGFPLKLVRESDLPTAEWITQLPEATYFIQNEYDPVGSYADVESYLKAAGVATPHIISWEGATHEYSDTMTTKVALASALRAANRGHR